VAASLIHFGIDRCDRIAILKGVGFSISECRSLPGLRSRLIHLPEPDAVAIAEDDEIEADGAISLVRSASTAPLVLFQSRNQTLQISRFNLVVPPLTAPQAWLDDLTKLIGESRALLNRSRMMRREMTSLRDEVRLAIERLAVERQRSRRLRDRSQFHDPYKKD
jgi:hypothetical protein